MVFTKTTVYKSLIFAFLVLFPFGQIFRMSVEVYGLDVRLQPLDLVAVLFFVFVLFGKVKRPKVAKWIDAIVILLLFSLLYSLTYFAPKEIIIGAFYLLRVLAYFSVFIITHDIVSRNQKLKSALFNLLIGASFAASVFGWVQYIFYPDLRALTAFGWDDHYFRLIGTFLDPGFTSLIIVFGFLGVVSKYLKKPSSGLALLPLFFLATLAFTYSRAGYLALFAGLLVFLFLSRKVKIFLAALAVFGIITLFLPNPGGEGVKLGRVSTVYARLDNYKESIELVKKFPLFGVGFNNLCIARQKFQGFVNTQSHACSGMDSSLLVLLATTGLLGLFIFSGFLFALIMDISKDVSGIAFLSSLAAAAVHSLFVNSLFYPWVMGYLALLGGVALKKN